MLNEEDMYLLYFGKKVIIEPPQIVLPNIEHPAYFLSGYVEIWGIQKQNKISISMALWFEWTIFKPMKKD
jgi:hypothetical protein